MNKILNEIKQIINENLGLYLPKVKTSDLEENGNIYYMNGKNGTEFDWYVNDKISEFMVFYDDKDNLGAIKLTLYSDGGIYICIYGNKGKKLIKEVQTKIEVSKEEIFQLAVTLKNEADDKGIFDASIEKINSDNKMPLDKVNEFKNNIKYYENMINQNKMFNMLACVSKKITEEGWKVGYMVKDEPLNENDSGWVFMAGNEADEYVNDSKNLELLNIYSVYQLDPDILNYIDNPVGMRFIRISSSEFEIDKNDKEIYTEKRK